MRILQYENIAHHAASATIPAVRYIANDESLKYAVFDNTSLQI